jgi:MraZ protein
MFRGTSVICIDEKGRLSVPSRYRQALQEQAKQQLVATIDPESTCVLLYPLPEWEELEAKIAALPSFDGVSRKIQRLLIGHAEELVLDGSGRILLPQPLREYAQLEKRVVLLGQGKKFELWDEAIWQQQRSVWLQDELKQQGLPEHLQSLSL